MNSIDLETKIEGLKKAIAEHEEMSQAHKDSLTETEKQLKDLGKIALPPAIFDEIVDAVERGINNFDFNDSNNYDTEFSIGYDNRVELDSLYLTHSDDLGEMIINRISEIFTEMDAPEDEPTAEEIAAIEQRNKD